MSDPAAHIRIVRRTEPETPRTWWMHAFRISAGLVILAVIAWRLGLAEVGVALTGGALIFLATPSARLRMTNALAAARRAAWVSSPLTMDGEMVLLTIDDEGLAVVEGRAYGAPAVRFDWETIAEIRFVGPATRPTEIQISASTDATMSGRLASAIFDELAKYGAQIPDPSSRQHG